MSKALSDLKAPPVVREKGGDNVARAFVVGGALIMRPDAQETVRDTDATPAQINAFFDADTSNPTDLGSPTAVN